MQTLFYFLVISFICYEAYVFMNAGKLVSFLFRIEGKKVEEYEGNDKSNMLMLFFASIMYWIVVVVGIIKTNHKALFAVILAISIISMLLNKKITSIPAKTLHRQIDAFLCMVILSAIVYYQFF